MMYVYRNKLMNDGQTYEDTDGQTNKQASKQTKQI